MGKLCPTHTYPAIQKCLAQATLGMRFFLPIPGKDLPERQENQEVYWVKPPNPIPEKWRCRWNRTTCPTGKQRRRTAHHRERERIHECAAENEKWLRAPEAPQRYRNGPSEPIDAEAGPERRNPPKPPDGREGEREEKQDVSDRSRQQLKRDLRQKSEN